MSRCALLCGSLASFVLCVPSFAQGRLFAVESNNTVQRLVRVDEASGSATVIGPLGFRCNGLAAAADGRLFAADNDGKRLVEVDPLTGAGTAVGSFTMDTDFMSGMAFHPQTGELWAVNAASNELVRIDLATAAVVPVGGLQGPTAVTALAWSYGGTVLYAMNSTNGDLFTLDPLTGMATFAAQGLLGVRGLATDPLTGELFIAEWQGGAYATLAVLDPITGTRTSVGVLTGFVDVEGLAFEPPAGVPLGSVYCAPAALNSRGLSARLAAIGSDIAVDELLTLIASDLPPSQFGYFLASRSQGFVPNAGGSQGNLCIALPLARFAQQLRNSGTAGVFAIEVDLTAIPLTPAAAVVAGDTWNFQAWYRDVNPGPTSNFSDAVSVTFL